ncbi:MAG: amidohydrolase family protein, partial [Caldilineaceae bacterium]|nr:amidohydrolase family protein [Caldilineaceae bacterium]
MIIDTHIHLYDPFRPGGAPWPDPADETIYLTTLPDRLTERARPAGMDGAIVVECSGWVEDNQWVLDLADDEPFIVGLVGNLDIHDERFGEHLDRFSKHPLFLGIRARLWQPDDLSRLRRLADLDLSLDLGISEQTLKIASEIPELRIVINHSANIKMDGDAPESDAVDLMRRAAAHPRRAPRRRGGRTVPCRGCHLRPRREHGAADHVRTERAGARPYD